MALVLHLDPFMIMQNPDFGFDSDNAVPTAPGNAGDLMNASGATGYLNEQTGMMYLGVPRRPRPAFFRIDARQSLAAPRISALRDLNIESRAEESATTLYFG